VQIALRDLARDHPIRDVLVDAAHATARGAELVRRLLTFSRREESRRRVVVLQPLVAEALALLRVTFPSSVRLATRFDPDVPEIVADPTQIHQIVMNLGTNAVQAMAGAGGELAVRLERAVLERDLEAHATVLRAGTYARLVVADTGSGMDDATLDRIFDPFFTTKGPDEGTGLGLSVVNGIVRNHDGGIVVRSARGRGTEFELYFPAAPRPRAAARPPSTSRDASA